jgi:hypothetical protein
MTGSTNRKPDRDLLLGFVAALLVSKANLRRDPCGDWNIFGRRGHISSDGVGAYVYLRPGTKRTWENAKRALGSRCDRRRFRRATRHRRGGRATDDRNAAQTGKHLLSLNLAFDPGRVKTQKIKTQ